VPRANIHTVYHGELIPCQSIFGGRSSICFCAESKNCPHIRGQLYSIHSYTLVALALSSLSSMSSQSSAARLSSSRLSSPYKQPFSPAKWTQHHSIHIPIESIHFSSRLTRPTSTNLIQPYPPQTPIDVNLIVKMSNITLPTREEFLEQLSTYPVNACAIIDWDTTSCAICTRDLADKPANDSEERAVLLHDTHAFGEECARKWLARKNTCPCCRTVLLQTTDNADAAIDNIEPIAQAFDEVELAHLLWQAGALSQRDPRTEALSDEEIMSIYTAFWNQWMWAIEADVDGSWVYEGPRSTEVAEALHELLMVRYSWWCHSPQQLNLHIEGNFWYTPGDLVVTERDLNRHVTIDFDCSLQSELRRELSMSFILSFADGRTCTHVSGHPVVAVLLDRVDGALQHFSGGTIKVSTLRVRLHDYIGDPDVLERRRVSPDLPQGYTRFIRYLVEETTLKAIARTRENRAARRARRTRPVSRAPRMSAPSTMDPRSRRS
jgi:hypothetical protein